LDNRHGIVARGNHHRHPQRELVAGLCDRLLIFDLHQHGFTGADIGDRVGEDVRPFLFGQRRLLSVLLRLFVDILACCRSLMSPTTTRSPITIFSVSTAPPDGSG
jgi:hypothetical protein